jgi:Protein of unknown function (DUF1579)
MAMEMPKVTDEHQKLHRLAGTWEGEESMEPSEWGPGGGARGKYVSRVDLEGFFVIQEYTQEQGGKITFRGHGVLGYDTQKREVAWYWLDSTGHLPDAPSRGQWNGNTLQLTSIAAHGHGRYTFKVEGNQMEFMLENSFDGGKTWKQFMTGRYRKTA